MRIGNFRFSFSPNFTTSSSPPYPLLRPHGVQRCCITTSLPQGKFTFSSPSSKGSASITTTTPLTLSARYCASGPRPLTLPNSSTPAPGLTPSAKGADEDNTFQPTTETEKKRKKIVRKRLVKRFKKKENSIHSKKRDHTVEPSPSTHSNSKETMYTNNPYAFQAYKEKNNNNNNTINNNNNNNNMNPNTGMDYAFGNFAYPNNYYNNHNNNPNTGGMGTVSGAWVRGGPEGNTRGKGFANPKQYPAFFYDNRSSPPRQNPSHGGGGYPFTNHPQSSPAMDQHGSPLSYASSRKGERGGAGTGASASASAGSHPTSTPSSSSRRSLTVSMDSKKFTPFTDERFETVNFSDVEKNAQHRVNDVLQRCHPLPLPSPSVGSVRKSLLKRAEMKFSFTSPDGKSHSLLAVGQSTKAKTALALCYMHAARLIDHYSLQDYASRPVPVPLHESTLGEETSLEPPNPNDFPDYSRFVEACQVYLRQNNNNELLLLEQHIIPPSENSLVNETAEEIYRRRRTRGQSPDRRCLLKLENEIRGVGKEMMVNRVRSKVHVATLSLDEATKLRAVGISSTSKDAKQFCAEHALLLLDRLKSRRKGEAGSGGGGRAAIPDETIGASSLKSIANSLTPRYAKLYSFYRFLFDTEEPELHFTKRKDPSDGNSERYYCVIKMNGVECEGMGVNRFEAERAAVEVALSQLELYDERILSLNTFLAKHPSASVDNIPTASLSPTLADQINQFVKDTNQRLEFNSNESDPIGSHSVNITKEDERLLQVVSSDRQNRNLAYAERLREDLHKLHSNEVYLKRFHPRRSTLAMWGVREQLLKYLDDGERVVVVCGTTGCGKTTQVPQYLFDHAIEKGEGDLCNIVVSQPRRLSTFSVAERIAQERLRTVGNEIGYAIRFDSRIGRHINLCTSGVLLKILSSQPSLANVTHLIIDEVHERDVNCDVILALIKGILEKNASIKIILMSATLQSDLFSSYFGGAPIINVEGAVYPVKVYHLEDVALDRLPAPDSNSMFSFPRGVEALTTAPNSFMFDVIERQNKKNPYQRGRQNQFQTVPKTDYNLIAYLIYRSVVFDMQGEVQGKSILVFLPGWKELVAAKRALEQAESQNTFGVFLNGKPLHFSIILLHSTVDAAKQRECFSPAPPGKVKVVLATNIAESGITIDDAAVVIDTGLIKQTSWSNVDRSKGPAGEGRETYGHFSTQLSLQYASKANCTQRKGRAGRTQGGVCYRLFTRATWEEMPEFQRAEIHRVPLTQVLLKLLSLGYTSPRETLLTFVEPPSTTNVDVSLQLLKHLGGIDAEERLTTLGLYLSQLPCDPRIGKMIMIGALLKCLDSVLTVAATADLNPFIMQRERAAEVRKKRYFFSRGSQSDHISYLNAYNAFCANMESYEFASFNLLHYNNLQLISKYKWQYRDILLQSGLIGLQELRTVAPLFQANGPTGASAAGGGPSNVAEDDNVFSPTSFGSDNNFEELEGESLLRRDGLHCSAYQGSLCVDTSILSQESLDVSLVKACVCASLFPHVAVLDPTPIHGRVKRTRKIRLRTKTHNSITPSSESACRRVGGPSDQETPQQAKQSYIKELTGNKTGAETTSPAMFYVFQDIFTLNEVKRSFLTNVSSISIWALLLFGAGEAQIEYHDLFSLCCIDRWLYFRIPPTTYQAISNLRSCLHNCMWRKYRYPSDVANNEALAGIQQFCKQVLQSPSIATGGDKEEEEAQQRLHRLVDSGSIVPPLMHMRRVPSGLKEEGKLSSENNSFDDDDDDDDDEMF